MPLCPTCNTKLLRAEENGLPVLFCFQCQRSSTQIPDTLLEDLLEPESKSVTQKAKSRLHAPQSQEKASKYRNKRCEYNGMKFDSLKELRIWKELELQEAAGEIEDLTHHRVYNLKGLNGNLICRYEADYTYMEKGELVVADAKGYQGGANKATQVFRMKARLMKDNFGITVREL